MGHSLRMHGVARREVILVILPTTCNSSSQMLWLLHEKRAIRYAISFGSTESMLPAPAMYSLDVKEIYLSFRILSTSFWPYPGLQLLQSISVFLCREQAFEVMAVKVTQMIGRTVSFKHMPVCK